jgi:hypothetical protein
MKQIRLNFILVLVMTFGLVFTASAPIFAQNGSDDSSQTTTSDSPTDNSGSDNSTSGSANSSNGGTEVESHLSSKAELHSQAQEILTELKDHHKGRSASEVEHQCEAHKKGLETKFSHISTNAERIQDRISSIYDKAVAYKTDNNLSPAGWDTLVAAADAAKQVSADSITNLKAVTPSLDCNNTSVASDVATFKAAAKETRDNLKAYRNAVKAVIKSLLDTKKADNSTEGSN